MRFIIFITTLLAFVWSCYWFIMSNKYSDNVSLWSNIDSANVSANLGKIRGFPNRFDTTITNLEIKQASFEPIKIVFDEMFTGAIVIFMIEMGIIAGQRLGDIKKVGIFLTAFAILIPTFNGVIGVLVSTAIGLSLGGSVMFGLLLASASFIAAPAVLRQAIPQAKPSLYITSALGITFPYNIIVTLPLLFALSTILHSGETIDLFNFITGGLI